jgi:glyoxylase-like metal-dependent hydrolase (beta-lactamase superfamily II)
MRLLAAHCGDIVADEGLIETGAVIREYRTIPVMTFFVETSDGVIVWDTGMCDRVRDDPVGYWGKMAKHAIVPALDHGHDVVARLGHAGYTVDDVNSHLHNDHAGMNGAFPAAKVLLRRRELAHAVTLMDEPSSGFVRNDFYSAAAEQHEFDYDERHILVQDGSGSLTLVSTPGHTPGHQCLEVRFPSGRAFVLSGDAVYTMAQLDEGRPPGLGWDREMATDSVETLAALRRDGAEVLVCHDPLTWRGVNDIAEVHHE